MHLGKYFYFSPDSDVDLADVGLGGHEHDLPGDADGLARARHPPRLPVMGIREVIAPLPDLVHPGH